MNGRAVDDGDRRLCAVLGHELRNPLAAALMSVTVASEMTGEDDPRAPFLRRAESDLERVSALLTSYLEFGRGAHPTRSVHGVRALTDGLRSRWGDALRVVGDGQDLAVNADARLLGRALDNLVDNALRAGASRVEVRVEPSGSHVRISVDDDGPGIEEALRGRIFEPFVSGRGSTGLGLAIAEDTIRAHGGRITCRPNVRGGRFRIELPLASEEGATA